MVYLGLIINILTSNTNKTYNVNISNEKGGNTLFMNRDFYKNNIKLNRIYNNALPEIIGF
ncbi:MAG TPA: hypothetical protein DCW51_08455 [Clostridium sp.]|nr:hypothetical protein [Clostridium sp.]